MYSEPKISTLHSNAWSQIAENSTKHSTAANKHIPAAGTPRGTRTTWTRTCHSVRGPHRTRCTWWTSTPYALAALRASRRRLRHRSAMAHSRRPRSRRSHHSRCLCASMPSLLVLLLLDHTHSHCRSHECKEQWSAWELGWWCRRRESGNAELTCVVCVCLCLLVLKLFLTEWLRVVDSL